MSGRYISVYLDSLLHGIPLHGDCNWLEMFLISGDGNYKLIEVHYDCLGIYYFVIYYIILLPICAVYVLCAAQ